MKILLFLSLRLRVGVGDCQLLERCLEIKESVLCLVVLVFCVTLTPALYHFNAVGCANVRFWSMEGILYSSQIYTSDL